MEQEGEGPFFALNKGLESKFGRLSEARSGLTLSAVQDGLETCVTFLEVHPTEKELVNVWFEKLRRWKQNLEKVDKPQDQHGPKDPDEGKGKKGKEKAVSDGTSENVGNKRKAKAQELEHKKKQKTLDSFMAFSSRSDIGVGAQTVFEKMGENVPLPRVAAILQTAERSLKRASLEKGKASEDRNWVKKEDQLKVAKYMHTTGFKFPRAMQEFPGMGLVERSTQRFFFFIVSVVSVVCTVVCSHSFFSVLLSFFVAHPCSCANLFLCLSQFFAQVGNGLSDHG